jgi:hypothetical protein
LYKVFVELDEPWVSRRRRPGTGGGVGGVIPPAFVVAALVVAPALVVSPAFVVAPAFVVSPALVVAPAFVVSPALVEALLAPDDPDEGGVAPLLAPAEVD